MILISGEALIDLIPDPAVENRYDAVLGGSPVQRRDRPRPARRADGVRLATFVRAERREASPPRSRASGVDLAWSRATPRRRRSPSSCAAPRRPDRAIPSISTRPPSTAPGRSLRNGRQARGTCTSARSPRSVRVTPSASSPRWNSRATTPPRVSIPTSARWSPRTATPFAPWSSGRSRSQVSSRRARRISNGCILAAPIEDTLGDWASRGPRFCVATLGGSGAIACLGAERLSVAAPKIDVVDTVGAGDSFMSALLSAMDRDGALGRQDGPPYSRTSARLARLRREGLCDHLHAQRAPTRRPWPRSRLSGLNE